MQSVLKVKHFYNNNILFSFLHVFTIALMVQKQWE